MDTERYCTQPLVIDPVKAIRAVHQAYLQLCALDNNVDCKHYDNSPALDALADVLRNAGHFGFAA